MIKWNNSEHERGSSEDVPPDNRIVIWTSTICLYQLCENLPLQACCDTQLKRRNLYVTSLMVGKNLSGYLYNDNGC